MNCLFWFAAGVAAGLLLRSVAPALRGAWRGRRRRAVFRELQGR